MKVNNLGPINNGEIKLAPLTILCGTNNQGKTYLSYTVYGILKRLPNLIKGFLKEDDFENFMESGKISFNKSLFIKKLTETIKFNLNEDKKNILESIFKSESNVFEDTDMEISEDEIIKFLNLELINNVILKVADTELILEVLDDKCTILMSNNELEKIVSKKRIKSFIEILVTSSIEENLNAFYIPAERIGINVFRGQLNANKIEMLDMINKAINDKEDNEDNKDKYFNAQLLKYLKRTKTLYPEPIEDYLYFINKILKYEIDDKNNELAAFVRKNIIKGRFEIESGTEKTFFRSLKGKKQYRTQKIPLHITSSSVKSVYGLDYFLEKIDFSKNNYLIIDEPEMNLHPSNQVEFAQLLNLIISKNINVIISTHSDFLVRKIQNIILRNEIRKEKGLNSTNVEVYNFENGTIRRIDLMDENEAFNNFNDIVVQIEDEYLDLLEEKAKKNKSGR